MAKFRGARLGDMAARRGCNQTVARSLHVGTGVTSFAPGRAAVTEAIERIVDFQGAT